MIELRPYQNRVIESIAEALAKGMKTPCASVATGGGKSHIISELANRFTQRGRRVLATSHVKELISQLSATAAIHGITNVGIHAASFGRRDLDNPYIIAQVQSVYKRMLDIGKIDALVIDEVHLLGDTEDGMYRQMIKTAQIVNPDLRIIGLSATPWRMKSGLIYGKGRFFESCVANVGMRELIDAGYLTPLVGKSGDDDPKLDGVKMRGGDYIASELEAAMADEGRVKGAVIEIVRQCKNRNRVLVFSSGRKHNTMIVEKLREAGQAADHVDGTMPESERDGKIQSFKSGAVKYLTNCAILTTGYDDPQIDAIVILRPTRSPGLLVQMAGRGLRKYEDKDNCLILDFGGCLSYFGPLDEIEKRIRRTKDGKGGGAGPQKTCPECRTVVPAGTLTCGCGYIWPKDLANHDTKASLASPLTSAKPTTYQVQRVWYAVHQGKDLSKAPTLKVSYKCGMLSFNEFISLDPRSHPYARSLALKWIKEIPLKTGDDGKTLTIANGKMIGNGIELQTVVEIAAFVSCLTPPTTIDVAHVGKYPNVVRRTFGKTA